ncbi:hypothetical protein [Xanthobacter autotrophicus]|uniref:hypothetical protein n=1 Tax=Xanthobacter autotrophicus TaxID=280 RepID=UPI0024A61A2B|nr:hypothetical protein [Xanthobacter autotrophicus]MDI4656568.1 hypothetical protein [Xanthobacter autotrophicus]
MARVFQASLLLSFVLSGCVAPDAGAVYRHSEPKNGKLVPLTPEISKSIHSGIKNVLKYPDSAKFGNIVAGEVGGKIVVCGWVNARNSFGGYTGMQPFTGHMRNQTSEFIVSAIHDTDIGLDWVRKDCFKEGIYLPDSPA